jgi:hypothetical protein
VSTPPGVRSNEDSPQPLTLWRIGAISLLCGLTALIVIGYAFSRPFTDFGVYFTAAHMFVGHGNPYSLTEVFAAEKQLGFNEPIPIMFLCPPWVLTMIAPLGFFHSYIVAWLCWLAILIAVVAIASKLLMDLYFGSLDVPEISSPPSYRYLFAFTFYPVLMALKFTQLSPLVFLGVAGLATEQARKRPIVAGLFLSITLLKPHLVLLLWVTLLLNRQWKILGTSAIVISILSLVTVLHYRAAFGDYRALMSGPYPAVTVSGMLAGIRGVLQTPNSYWIQYIPLLLGLGWIGFYWRQHRKTWNLSQRLPALITSSIMAAPYGYTHDQLLLMIPIIYIASQAGRAFGKIPFKLVALYTALNISVLLVLILWVHWAILIAPVAVAFSLMSDARGRFGDLSEEAAAT